MEKSAAGMDAGASGPPIASAPPPPSAPPSYEEAVGSIGMINPHRNLAPYPTGQPGMPTPYAPAGIVPPSMSDAPSDTYAVQAPTRTEIRVVRQPVPYALGPNPVKMQCPTCMANVKTSTVSQRQPSAHICCIILCVLGCCLCSCLPYCMSAFLTVHHYCPSCSVYIGTWKG
ncbi:lipopolysaccharide-induced tumor necrosis factor-alpha factor homolog [Venturia canescens]|uniref:lipopolysaccharide-induced tumor necrosis factor-alpha factor homolog n=1 Tax=Venturia canescens TaxID=32260 RepID=UPI001C9C336E|nr:lipopolysaccharide-induced tumor necrosis factor-alpha factor homolog [Venturia canescens]